MKKTLALVLALAMVFSTITVAYAEGTIGAEAQLCADLGMLKGETGTVDAAYTATTPTRLQAAVMFLRLKGLEAEALAFTGEENFADGNIAWAEGSNLLAYLKANPQLGWVGDGTNFNPNGLMTAQAYYKVMLEALGYKQTTPEVVGDFAYADVLAFAASKGLTKVAAVTNFTVNDLAVATVEALKANMKEGGKTLAAALVEAGKIDNAKAVAAGLVEETAATTAVPVKSAKATGNAVVEVTFEDAIDASAANVANYTIEGLAVKAATVSGENTVILDTDAMTSGTLYNLTVGEKTVKFTGIAKVSGGPEITTVESLDIEKVVVTFNKNVDLKAGMDVANYSISGVEIVSAEVDESKVTLTTEGLKNKTGYTLKVTNMKSVDGVVKKSGSKAFTTKFDLTAPKVTQVEPRTNQRLVVTFSEPVTQESAENLENYTIKVDETDGAEIEIISITWNSDDEDKVEVITEALEKNEDYKITVNGIVDQTKSANTMTRPSTAVFDGLAEDNNGPKLEATDVLSPTKILVEFSDASNIDEASAIDLNNYELEGLTVDSIETVVDNKYDATNKEVTFKVLLTVEEMETGKTYDLTINDVLDEFGNAISANTIGKAKAISSNFAAAQVVSMTATGKNTIVVIFDKEVDEASAENLANYTIDEGVGAPTKAEYEKAGAADNSVTLTVNDLVNGYGQYDLTIDNVMDLAGNDIYYKANVTNNVSWETGKPALEDVDSVNKKVVALTFDEKVKFNNTTTLKLKYNNFADEVDLVANAMADEDTVVEFAKADGSDLPDVAFTVYSLVYSEDNTKTGISDLIGNVFEFVYDGTNLITFERSAADYDKVEVDSYKQIDAKTFEVTMSKNVKYASGKDANTDMGGFNATIDENVITFVKTTGTIADNTDYEINLAANFVDEHGITVKNSDSDTVTKLTGEYTDEEAPMVDEVVAKNRTTIKVTFNERIDESQINPATLNTFFVLRNYDKDEAIQITGIADNADDDGIIELQITKPLEARYEYELVIKANAVEDFAGKKNADETVYFDGTNLVK